MNELMRASERERTSNQVANTHTEREERSPIR